MQPSIRPYNLTLCEETLCISQRHPQRNR
jgi:hypothetical protein